MDTEVIELYNSLIVLAFVMGAILGIILSVAVYVVLKKSRIKENGNEAICLWKMQEDDNECEMESGLRDVHSNAYMPWLLRKDERR